jgi:uncharacterized protein YndB with AHSA1/START domain
MLKKIAISLFLVITLAIVALLSIAATRPPTYHVERSQSMAASPEAVFSVVNDLHRFHEWSPWQKLDPAMKVTFDGPPTGVGASYTWAGNKDVGEGRMTITEATPPGSLTQKLEFLKPEMMKATSAMHFTITPENDGSRVTWAIDGNNNYVSRIMCMFVSMDAMMGKDFEAGLASLKQISEAEPAQAATPASPSETAAPAKP